MKHGYFQSDVVLNVSLAVVRPCYFAIKQVMTRSIKFPGGLTRRTGFIKKTICSGFTQRTSVQPMLMQ